MVDGAVSVVESSEALTTVLVAEYGFLQSALAMTWSTIQNRTSVLLGVLSAIAVALGIVGQGQLNELSLVFAVVLLAVGLFLGLATFIRVVQASRESVLLLLNLNRIRHHFVEAAPAAAAYLMLPTADDEASLYRGLASGVPGRARSVLTYGLVQTAGVIAVVDGVVAAALAAVAVYAASSARLAAIGSGATFVVVVALLLWYWAHAITSLRRGLVVRFPSEDASAGQSR